MERKQKWKLQRRKEKAAIAVLLSILLLFQTGTAFAETGTVSSNETAGGEGLVATVSENQSSANEEPEFGGNLEDKLEEALEDTVSGQNLPEIQAGAIGPENPLHHCTKKDDNSDWTDFSYIYFGSYPQSKVTDSATKAAIDKAVSTTGITVEGGTDVWVNGSKYRRSNWGEGTGYRYFKWERIKWRVLRNDGKTLFVIADKALDCKNYNEKSTKATWETSTLRSWMNSSFYTTAFSSRERNDIVAQNVKNEKGNNTNDKIYLLSIGEASNVAYGFCSDKETESESRKMKTSDYAYDRGAARVSGWSADGGTYKDTCCWWVRTPDKHGGSSEGTLDSSWTTRDNLGAGVCPVLHINLYSAFWYETDDGTSGEGGESKKAEKPTASLPTGSRVSQNAKLRLSCATAGASIYYTTDGTPPSKSSTRYSGEITIDRDMRIRAIAVRGSQESDEATFIYRIKRNGNGPENPLHKCTKKDDGSDVTDFSYIYFGSYPQSEVKDSTTIAAIEKAISTSGIQEDAGIDVWVNGSKYRRISKRDTTYDGYFDKVSNKGYRYFKWERIKWRVLENDGKNLFVVADKAIDCKCYNEKIENNVWETSTLRNWLNNGFYNTAFNTSEKNAVMLHTVTNENSSSNDKIYLLSAEEVIEWVYGFCDNYQCKSPSRMMKVSGYANARGTAANGRGNGYWWLLSPGEISSDVNIVDCEGLLHRGGDNVRTNHDGVCPAMRIKLSSGTWFMADNGTSGGGGDEKAAMPTASIPTGSSVAKNIKLSLSCATAGASIYYTTDGTTPTTASALYSGKIAISRDMTVKAVAVCRGYQPSDVAEFSYKLKKSGSGENNGNGNSGQNGGNSRKKVQKLAIKVPSKKLAAGTKVKLTLKVTPKNAANKAIKWKSSNKKYATVDNNGKITLKKKGIGKKVTITAAAQDGSGKKASIKIKIMKHAVKTIKLKAPKKTLKAGKSMSIKATVKTTGKNANKSLKWTSSNKKYAAVNSKGKVTAKKAGKGKTVTITAKSTDGSKKKATVQIKIK